MVALDEVDSTNTDAMRRLTSANVAPDRPFWVVSDLQTAGKGRSGRGWSHPRGNLAASLALPAPADAETRGQLALVAGLAVYDAIADALRSVAPTARIELKWPNDVLVERAKISGILIEATEIAGEWWAVVGCGINIVSAPEIAGRAAISLNEMGTDTSAPEVFKALAANWSRHLELWRHGENFAAIRARWLQSSLPIDTSLTVNAGDEQVAGYFAGLGPRGELLIKDPSGRIRRVTFGDVAIAPSRGIED
ncbi:MAG: biotin--[acetyl-CoA-carboxylase] ligase [Pseudomonadota bacterium]